MQSLNAKLHRRLLVERAAVAATLDKGNARHHRIAGQCLDVEDQRTANQSVDEQAMRGRIDVGNAVMRSLEMQAVRRDHALQRVQRRARHTGAGRSRNRGDGSHDLAFELRRLAIGRERRAHLAHPWRNLQLRRMRRTDDASAGCRGHAGTKQCAAIQQPVAGGIGKIIVRQARSAVAHSFPPCRPSR